MKFIYTGILLIFLLPLIANAAGNNENDTEPQRRKRTDANIAGHVLNATNGEHLAYATVVIKGTTIGIATDATGHYYLKDLPTGQFVISASAMGYKSEDRTITLEQGKTIEVNFSLQEAALDVDEVVVSASRNETNKKEAATIVNVISSKLFETTASTTLAETMNYQPGLRVETTCGNCGALQLRINGLDGQYSQILLDGHPIFSSLSGVQGLEQLPVSMIERVEVIRGGGSALFGSNAIGGVVNVITKEPLRSSASVSNITNIMKGGRTDFNTNLNGTLVSDDHKAGISLFGMVRDRKWYDRNKDGFSDIPELQTQMTGFRGYYKTSNYSRIKAEYHHINEDRRGGNNISEPVQNGDVTEWQKSKIDAGSLNFDISTRDYKNRFKVYASAQRVGRNSYFAAERDTENYGRTQDITYLAGTQYTHAFDKLWFMPAELMAGFEYSHNDLHDNFQALDRLLEQETHIVGGFFQNEWKTEKLGILIGGRLDKHNLMDKVVFSPRATVRYSPAEMIGLRASYSSGYRAPQAYNEDLHIDAVGGALSLIEMDPNLKPEYSHSISGSADLYHNFGRLQANLLIEGFYTTLKDVFTLDKIGEDENGNHIYLRRNGSGAKVKGLNLEAKLGLPGIFDVQLGYTFQHSRYKEPERWSDVVTPQRKMFRSPDNYGYFTSNVNITRNFTASLFGNYTGPMLVQHTFDDEDMEHRTPGFFDMGIKLAYNFALTKSINLELSAGVKNIFDSFQKDLDYGPGKDGAYVYGPALPRTIFFGVKFAL